jgi:hypothetical protein
MAEDDHPTREDPSSLEVTSSSRPALVPIVAYVLIVASLAGRDLQRGGSEPRADLLVEHSLVLLFGFVVMAVLFWGMWGGGTARFDSAGVTLRRFGRTRLEIRWGEVAAVLFHTHVPTGMPRVEVVRRGTGPSAAGRHSGAAKRGIPLMLGYAESEVVARRIVTVCARYDVDAVHLPRSEGMRRMLLGFRSAMTRVFHR